jgi:hypothetical protein
VRRELISRLEALEEVHSEASPGMINRALQRLSASGQWPRDPAVLKIVQRIRLFQIEMEVTTGASGPEDALQRLDFNPTEEEEAWARWRWQWRPRCSYNMPG